MTAMAPESPPLSWSPAFRFFSMTVPEMGEVMV